MLFNWGVWARILNMPRLCPLTVAALAPKNFSTHRVVSPPQSVAIDLLVLDPDGVIVVILGHAYPPSSLHNPAQALPNRSPASHIPPPQAPLHKEGKKGGRFESIHTG